MDPQVLPKCFWFLPMHKEIRAELIVPGIPIVSTELSCAKHPAEELLIG